MKTMTARDLKNHTGEVMKAIAKREEVVVTFRGRPAAVILPFEETKKKACMEIRPFEEAWEDIEDALKRTKPAFRSWQEGIQWSRKRM